MSDSGSATAHKVPQFRAFHLTAAAWDYKPLRDPAMQMIKDGKFNAVELDIKDEDGNVGFKSTNPLVAADGANKGSTYDAAAVIQQLHSQGLRVIGREVVYKDPKLCHYEWTGGNKDMVIQNAATGQPWQGTYGACAFTNFANADVNKYNTDIAVEAAKLGFDDVLFDYVRRPDGKISEMKIPDLQGDGEEQVAAFVKQTRLALQAQNPKTLLGASVFGIAASRPEQIAQNIPMMAKWLDYVSPMVYPSHWNAGEYGVKSPINQPYDIVVKSLADFNDKVKGTNAVVIPWLQDFTLHGVVYTRTEIQAEIKAAHDDGIDSYLMWNGGCKFTANAYDPRYPTQ